MNKLIDSGRDRFCLNVHGEDHMAFQMKLAAAALGFALGGLALNASACSTIIVGKDVSKTGNIIVGHNEDNGGRILTAQYWVPAATHKKGEKIKFEEAAAEIPQVEKTFGFYWSQTYDPSGASFSDGFVNENGVTIASNACTGIYKDDIMPTKDGGIGYGIRRLMAERATSARHAVDIAIDLLGKYGYFSEGRTYTIADSKEAWQIAIHQGNTWVARRVKDNEVVYIPNNFMMDKVDATDTANVIVAPGMIERAIKNGRYKPAKEGVYSDFNYRVAVAPAERRSADYNFSRNQLAWKKIAGLTITDPEKFPYSVTPNKKFGVEDVKAILRTHEADIAKQDNMWYHTMSLGICRATTHESVVYEMNANPLLIAGFRTHARPCQTPYVPFYPLARPAEGTAFFSWEKATAEHFKGTPEYFSYRAEWPVTTFVNAANTYDFQRQDLKRVQQFVAGLEADWAKDRKAVEEHAKTLLKVSEYKATEYLHAYNLKTFREAQAEVAGFLTKMAPYSMSVMADSIDPKSDKTVDIVLYSKGKMDATKIDLKKTYAGVGRASIGNKIKMADKLAQPVKTTKRDVDGDGKVDMILTFTQKDLAKNMLAGATYDIWLHTFVGNQRIAVMDTAFIETEGYKGPATRTENADV